MKQPVALLAFCLLASQVHSQTPQPSPAQQSNAFFVQGQTAEKAGDPVAAETAYRNALKVNPGNANARNSLGLLKINAASIAARGREAKFGAVMIPEFHLDEATLQESLDALTAIIGKQGKDAAVPNFVIDDPGKKFGDRKISMHLKGIPAKAVMKYLAEQTGAKVRYDEHAIVISPK